MHTLGYLSSLHLLPLVLILTGLMFVEADSVIVGIGILIHLTIIPLWVGTAIALLAGFANDYLWFRVGHHLGKNTYSFTAWVERVTRRANVHIKSHPFKAIFLTKFMYGIVGVHRATLVRCGMNNLSFKAFALYNGLSVVVWAAFLLSLGYFASDSLSQVNHVIRIIELSFLTLLVLLFAIFKIKKVWRADLG